MQIIDVIIPAYNEENSIHLVMKDLPLELIREVVVVNNNSSDKTKENAIASGATVIDEPVPGYGNACLKGINYIKTKRDAPDVIVFLDADYSDYPEQLTKLVKPILDDNIDMVIGTRALGNREKGSMTIPQLFGNWLATRLLKIFYGIKFTDLGPFRAIKYNQLLNLNMTDKTYGWTVEMQVKAAKKKLSTTEIPVDYRKRIGKSKISGTIKGTILAGQKIISTIFKNL